MSFIIGTEHLSVDFPDARIAALRDVSFQLQPGESVGVLGPSGCGKSTLAWSLLNLQPPGARVQGAVWFKGVNLLSCSEKHLRTIRGREIALISQEPASALNPILSISSQIGDVLQSHLHLTSMEREYRIRSILAEVGLDTERALRARPHELSSGERQRAAIAQALVCDPPVLIADEPTSALDDELKSEVIQSLIRLKRRRNTSLVLITHDATMLDGLVDRVMVMNDGEIVGCIEPQHASKLSIMPNYGRAGSNSAPQSGPVLIEARNVSKVYSQKTALDGIDFTVHEGECIALTGPSGSGKSTLGRCLAGIEKPSSGSIRHTFSHNAKVQYVYPDALGAMNPNLTVAGVINEPGRLLRSTERTVYELLAMVNLSPALATRFPSELSGGQRQRVLIARALAAQPRVLVLDESLSSLDVALRAELASLLLTLWRSTGLSLLFIVHDLPFARSIPGRIVELRDGRIKPCKISGAMAS